VLDAIVGGSLILILFIAAQAPELTGTPMPAPLLGRSRSASATGGPCLTDVSIRVEPGEVVGLIGATGRQVDPDEGARGRRDDPARIASTRAGLLRTRTDALAAGIVIDPQELNLIVEQSVAENTAARDCRPALPGS